MATSTPRPPSPAPRRARDAAQRHRAGVRRPATRCTARGAPPGCSSTTPARPSPSALGVRPDEVTFTSLRHRGRAPRAARPAPRPRPRGPLAAGLRRRALRGAPRRAVDGRPGHHAAGRRAGSGRRRGAGRPGRDRRPEARRWSRSRAANHEVGTVQPVAEVAAASTARATLPSSSTPAPRWAGSRSPTAGRRPPARAHKWGGPAGVGVLLVRKGARWRQPVPRRRPGRRAGHRLRERARPRSPRPRRCRRWSPSATRSTPASAPWSTGSARAVAATDPGRRGRRRPGRPAPPPGDVLVPLRRRRGAGHRAGPPRVRRRQRLGLHRLDADARATCSRRWACSRTATSGSR